MNLLFSHEGASEGERFVEGRDLSVELALIDGPEDFAHPRAGGHAERYQMSSEQHWRRRLMLDAERPGSRQKPVHGVAVEPAGFTSEAVGFREAGE